MIIDNYELINKIKSGESSVEKYKIYKDKKYYLLRVFDARFMNSRYTALHNIETLYANGINVPRVYDKGILNNGNGFALLDWIEGIPLDENLISSETEIEYGKIVADELIKMHNVKSNNKVILYDKYIKSFKKKVDKINNLKIDNHYIGLFENYVNEYSEILKELNNNSIIHGDFHPGNIVVNNNKLTFIDLDVCKISTPWEDLASNACNMNFSDFYSSVILNYFKDDIPRKFWKTYYLYGCLYVLDYILYSLRTEGKTLNDGIERLNGFMSSFWTQNFTIFYFFIAIF